MLSTTGSELDMELDIILDIMPELSSVFNNHKNYTINTWYKVNVRH